MVVFFRVLRLKGKGILKPFNYIEAARIVEGEVKGLVGLISSENGGLVA